MTIHLVGGAPQAPGLEPVWDSFTAAAKRRSEAAAEPKPVVICILQLPDEEGDPHDWATAYAADINDRWPDATFQVVVLKPGPEFNPQQPSHGHLEATAEPFPDDLNQIAGLVVGGGWTPAYLHCLLAVRDRIARAVSRDLPYLGFSAGAAIASRHALIGGAFADGIRVQSDEASEELHDLTVVDGLALISTTVQVHTDAWSNEGSVISALDRNLAGHGVSIDEGTAVVIDPVNGRTHRLGRGRLRWFSREQHGVLVRTEEPPPPTTATGAQTDPATDASHG